MPPVGKYETWHSMGKQPLSACKTLPSWGFGSSSWNTEGKRFLSQGHSLKTLQVGVWGSQESREGKHSLSQGHSKTMQVGVWGSQKSREGKHFLSQGHSKTMQVGV